MTNWTKSKIGAIILLIFLTFIVIVITPFIVTWYNHNNELQQERSFHIVYTVDTGPTRGHTENETPDLLIDLLVTYPHGTLIVDDPVKIFGIAVLSETLRQTLTTSIALSFQNAQAYPYSQNENGITEGQQLNLWKLRNENLLIGNATIVWALEGTYYPTIVYRHLNSTGGEEEFSGTSDVKITVYPKSELAQITTNTVSMILTFVLYGLTVVGTGSLILSLWDRQQPTEHKKDDSKSTDTSSDIIQKKSNGKTDGKIQSKKEENNIQKKHR
jgi:hypothetical protein